MNFSLLVFISIAGFIYKIEHVHSQGALTNALAKCLDPRFIQHSTIKCQRELYKSLNDAPSQNCSAAAITMLPDCLNRTTLDCFMKELGVDFSKLPAGTISSGGMGNFVSSPELFCSNIVPVMIAPVTNCSMTYFMAQGMCVLPFQMKFNANYADPDLCSAYSTQMNCMRTSMESNCEAAAVQNFTATYPFMFEKGGNPFCHGSGNSLIAQSFLIAICLVFIKMMV